jgi:hypothetical protein
MEELRTSIVPKLELIESRIIEFIKELQGRYAVDQKDNHQARTQGACQYQVVVDICSRDSIARGLQSF